MTRTFRLVGPGLLGGLIALAAPVPAQERPTFRAKLDLVPVAAVVRDEQGRPVPGLNADDFVVVDGGTRRAIVGFSEDQSARVSLAILVDESGSMRGQTPATRRAMAAVLDELRAGAVPGDQVALLGFDSSVHEIVAFTPDLERISGAIDHVGSFGATAVHDAIAISSRQLADLSGRRALVVVTDGMDTRSRLTITEVSGIASAIDVPVYVLLVGAPAHSAARQAEAAAAQTALDDLAGWTGGEAFPVGRTGAEREAAARIVSDVRHQYLMAFESASEPGWRLLDIQTRQPGLIVRARSAYVAGRDGSRRTK